jgi:hypothetical protein
VRLRRTGNSRLKDKSPTCKQLFLYHTLTLRLPFSFDHIRSHCSRCHLSIRKLSDNEVQVVAVPTLTGTESIAYGFLSITPGQPQQYETICYSPTESLKAEIILDNRLLEVTKSCKLALKGFRRATTRDDAMYMVWIAALCINHEDPMDRQHHTLLIHRLPKEARNHNILHYSEPGNCNGAAQRPSNIVQFTEDELASPANGTNTFTAQTNRPIGRALCHSS